MYSCADIKSASSDGHPLCHSEKPYLETDVQFRGEEEQVVRKLSWFNSIEVIAF